MPYPRTGLLAEGRKCPCKPRTFNHIRPKLVFRGPNQECSHNTNEIRALRPELVFREVPGELVQWGRQTQRFRWVALCLALLEPVRRRVVQVPAPPVRLRLLPAFHLALRLSADMLPVSYSWVRPKPPPAYCAGPLPGVRHVDVFIVTMPVPKFRSEVVGRFWRVSMGRFSRAPKSHHPQTPPRQVISATRQPSVPPAANGREGHITAGSQSRTPHPFVD